MNEINKFYYGFNFLNKNKMAVCHTIDRTGRQFIHHNKLLNKEVNYI